MTGMDLRGLYGHGGGCCGARRGEAHRNGCPEQEDAEAEERGADHIERERAGIVAHARRQHPLTERGGTAA